MVTNFCQATSVYSSPSYTSLFLTPSSRRRRAARAVVVLAEEEVHREVHLLGVGHLLVLALLDDVLRVDPLAEEQRHFRVRDLRLVVDVELLLALGRDRLGEPRAIIVRDEAVLEDAHALVAPQLDERVLLLDDVGRRDREALEDLGHVAQVERVVRREGRRQQALRDLVVDANGRVDDVLGDRLDAAAELAAATELAQLTGPSDDEAEELEEEKPNSLLDQMIDINSVEGQLRASSLKQIGEIVDNHPEAATAIIRGWMYQDQGRG